MLHTPNSAGSRGGVWGGLPALLLFLDQTKKNIRGETPPPPSPAPFPLISRSGSSTALAWGKVTWKAKNALGYLKLYATSNFLLPWFHYFVSTVDHLVATLGSTGKWLLYNCPTCYM